MTQEELFTKAETLYNVGEYSQIISLIQSIPEEQQTYNLLYLLALSYSYNLEGDDDDNQHHALKILKKIADQGEYDLKWLYLIGKIYFQINQEEYAIEYFDKIARIFKKDNEFNELINIQYFIDRCKEYLYERALAVVFIVLKEASKDDKTSISNIKDNKIEVFFPKYDIKVQIEINHLHRSGATLFFKIMYPDNYYQTYNIDGYSNTYEKGIADAVNKFVCIINKDFIEHCK